MQKFLMTLIFLVLFAASSFAATTADVVFVVDESGSMSGEHAWLSTMVLNLDGALTTAGITNNRFSLIGYGSGNPAPRTISVGGDSWGTAAQLASATGSLITSGATEDGYAGIQYFYNTYSYRNDAALNFILVTDEDRDILTQYNTVTFQSLLDQLRRTNALLNAVVNSSYTKAQSPSALGVDSDGNGYVADGNGGYTTATGYSASGGSGTTIADYVNLALASGGAGWNLNLLRAGGLTATSFTNAFVDIKVGEIEEQDPTNVVPEPSTSLLLGAGLLGLAYLRRRNNEA